MSQPNPTEAAPSASRPFTKAERIQQLNDIDKACSNTAHHGAKILTIASEYNPTSPIRWSGSTSPEPYHGRGAARRIIQGSIQHVLEQTSYGRCWPEETNLGLGGSRYYTARKGKGKTKGTSLQHGWE